MENISPMAIEIAKIVVFIVVGMVVLGGILAIVNKLRINKLDKTTEIENPYNKKAPKSRS